MALVAAFARKQESRALHLCGVKRGFLDFSCPNLFLSADFRRIRPASTACFMVRQLLPDTNPLITASAARRLLASEHSQARQGDDCTIRFDRWQR